MNKFIITIVALLLTGSFLAFFAFQSVQPKKVLSVSNELKVEEKTEIESVSEINTNKKELSETKLVSILFGGDMMFDRYIRQIGEQKGYNYIISDLEKIFDDSDCVIANLEGPITNNKSVSINSEFGSPDNYRFTFDPIITKTLKDNNFCIVNIGNNHIGNFGIEGIAQTKKFLKEKNINYFGDEGTNKNNRYFIKDFDTTKIAFVNYNQFTSDAFNHTLEDIKKVKVKADFVVLYMHWGEEYKTTSRKNEQDIAHQFIDEGVDVIIGSHPHVVQEKEIYKNKTIYYSLGNFVFDQYFSKDTKQGLLVNVIFDKNQNKIIFDERTINLNTSAKTSL